MAPPTRRPKPPREEVLVACRACHKTFKGHTRFTGGRRTSFKVACTGFSLHLASDRSRSNCFNYYHNHRTPTSGDFSSSTLPSPHTASQNMDTSFTSADNPFVPAASHPTSDDYFPPIDMNSHDSSEDAPIFDYARIA